MAPEMTRRSLTTRQRVGVFDRCGGLCHICGQKVQAGERWELEHVRPLALDGADDESNWSVAHVACHRVKTRDDQGRIAKALRQRAKDIGIRRSKRPMPFGRKSPWKQKIGTRKVVARDQR